MICAAADDRTSFDDIEGWRKEILEVENTKNKPFVLNLTKFDITQEQPEEAKQDERLGTPVEM